MEADFFKNSQNASIYKGVGRTRLLEECSELLCLKYSIDSSEIFPFLKSQKEINQSHQVIDFLINSEDLSLNLHQKLKKISPHFHISVICEMLHTGQVLSYRDINGIALALELNNYLCHQLDQQQIQLFAGSKDKINKSDLFNFINKITTKVRKFVLADFEFNLSGDSKLKKLLDIKSKQIKKIHDKVLWFINKNPSIQSSIDDLDFFDGTYLLPVKSSNYESSMGVIEKRSNTGSTFYVSLNCLRSLNDDIRTTQNSIEQYIYVHEKTLSNFLRLHLEELLIQFESLKNIDVSLAKSLFCKKYQLVKPIVSTSKFCSIEKIFHPFIEDYVENSFHIERSKDVFLITGSNYGGKSVFLKSVAFCFFLNQSGFFIPAHKASLPFCSKLFYFAGDLQDIEKSESSFSAEAKYYKKVLDQIDNKSLVFLDEIFSSTSSLEGSSLAHGLISTITKKFKGAKVFVTTHHELLKEFLSSLDSCSFASFSLDANTGLPNFKLIPDRIENSNAIKTFTRIFDDHVFLDEILQEVKLVNDLNQDLSLQVTTDTIQDKKNDELEHLKDEVLQLKSAFELYKKKKSSVSVHIQNQSEAPKEKIQTVKSLEELEESLSKKINDTLNAPRESLTFLEGENYYSKSLQTSVKLLKTKKNSADVLKKSFRMTLPLHDLIPSNQQAHATKKPNQSYSSFELVSEAKTKIDGRGKRLEEFKSEVNTQLNHLLTGNILFIDIIHGHGTGVLKNWLLEMVKESPDLTIEKKEDGNDGSTIIKLR